MKNYLKGLAILFFAIGVGLTSCKKDNTGDGGGGDNPDPNPNTNLFEELWQYDLSSAKSTEIYVAQATKDENENIYTMNSLIDGNKHIERITVLDKTGNLVWEKDYEGIYADQLVYYQNKLFFVTESDVSTYATVHAMLYFINPADGSVIQSHDLTDLYGINQTKDADTRISISNNRLYVRADGDKEYILAYELDGTFVWMQEHKLPGVNFSYADEMVSISNGIYVLSTDSLFKYVDNGSTSSLAWVIAANEVGAGALSPRHLIIDKNNNLCFYGQSQEGGSGGTEVLRVVSTEGEIVYDIPIGDTDCEQGGRFFSTKDGDFILNNDDSGDYVKIDNQGNIQWTYDGDWSGWGLVALADNGNIFYDEFSHNQCLNSSGENIGEIDENGNSMVFLNNGDIIIMGAFDITCVKGDGSTLDKQGWSRPFGNSGNTNSKPE